MYATKQYIIQYIASTDNSSYNYTMKMNKCTNYSSISVSVENNFVYIRYMFLVFAKRKIPTDSPFDYINNSSVKRPR